MRFAFGTRSLLAIFAFAACLAPQAYGEETHASFESEVKHLDAKEMQPLLEAICPGGVRNEERNGSPIVGCGASPDDILATSTSERRRYSRYPLWQVDGVIFGHFLSPTSEDAALAGAGKESHPYLFGGTLLLTKDGERWRPVWYKMGVVTRHCRPLAMPTGRQVLICEESDDSMGIGMHLLYTVDLLQPKVWQESKLLVAMSRLLHPELNEQQVQTIDRVVFLERGTGGVVFQVYARHQIVEVEWGGVWQDSYAQDKNYRIDFRFDGDRLKPTPETAEAAKLFSEN